MSNLTLAINAFLQAVCLENLHSPSVRMDSALKSCLAGERTLRQLFANDPENPLAQDRYSGIFDIFNLPVEARLARPRDWNAGPNFVWHHEGENHYFPSKYILPIKPYLRRAPGTPCIVQDIKTFQQVFKVFTGGALEAIKNWDNIVVAGGSVLACLTPFPDNSPKALQKIFQSPPYKSSDIDLFLWGMNEEAAKEKMQQIFNDIDSSLPWDAVCFRTKNTITIQAEYPKRPVQIIMRLYRNIVELLTTFDIDSGCVAYNGTNVFTNPRGLAAILRQCNTIDLLRRSPSYEHRLAKYSDRGYEIFYPSLERGRIDYQRLASPRRVKFPQGLGRLIVYEIMRADYQYFPRLYEEWGGNVRPSPVPAESLRPSNYDYAWCRIPYGPKWWDPRKVQEHVEQVGRRIINVISENRTVNVHHHVITTGTMVDCLERCCGDYVAVNETNGPRGRGRQIKKDLASGLFSGPATFITDDPGRQMIGSFHPINDDDWELEAYFDDYSDSYDGLDSSDSEAAYFGDDE